MGRFLIARSKCRVYNTDVRKGIFKGASLYEIKKLSPIEEKNRRKMVKQCQLAAFLMIAFLCLVSGLIAYYSTTNQKVRIMFQTPVKHFK